MIRFTNHDSDKIQLPSSSSPIGDTGTLGDKRRMAEFPTGKQQHRSMIANGSGTNLWPMGHHQPQLKRAMNIAQHKIINLLKTLRVFKTLFFFSFQTQMHASRAQMFEMTLCSRNTKWVDSLVQYKHSDGFCVCVCVYKAKL